MAYFTDNTGPIEHSENKVISYFENEGEPVKISHNMDRIQT